jgi:hypothetical protein
LTARAVLCWSKAQSPIGRVAMTRSLLALAALLVSRRLREMSDARR